MTPQQPHESFASFVRAFVVMVMLLCSAIALSFAIAGYAAEAVPS